MQPLLEQRIQLPVGQIGGNEIVHGFQQLGAIFAHGDRHALFVDDVQDLVFARVQGQACEGFTVGVVAALTFIITKAAGTAPADLAGLPDQSLWQAACKAHHKRPDLVHSLPDIPLSRGEFHAIRWGLEKRAYSLPMGRDIFEITNITHPEHGNLMSKTLQIIAYAKRPQGSTSLVTDRR